MKKNQLRLALLAALGLVGVVSFTLYTGGTDPKTGLPDPIVIDGRTVEFSYTDDNTGEDLHIYAEKGEYKDGLSHAEPILAVVNRGVAQDIELAAYFSGTDKRIRSVWVATEVTRDILEPIMGEKCGVDTVILLGDKEEATTTCIAVQTGTSTRQEARLVWAPLSLTERTTDELIKETVNLKETARKDVGAFSAKKKSASYPVAEGQVVYFKVFVEFPRGIRDQVYFEAIGSEGGYGILK